MPANSSIAPAPPLIRMPASIDPPLCVPRFGDRAVDAEELRRGVGEDADRVVERPAGQHVRFG